MHLVQLSIDVPKALRFYRRLWPARCSGLQDEGFLFKTLLADVFAGAAPRPWRVQSWRPGGESVILGYSEYPADVLQQRARMALPELTLAISPDNIFSHPVEIPVDGTVVQLWTTICPTVRQGSRRDGTHRERDVFLVEVERASAEDRLPAPRLDVYAEYLRRRLQAGGELKSVLATAWRLQDMTRKGKGGLPTISIRLPSTTMTGELRITDRGALKELIATGVGRARAYGHGMLLLKAA